LKTKIRKKIPKHPQANGNDWGASKIAEIQDWLGGIPGLDEAMSLANAIHHIESGEYDLIVFDTAPTG
jgi:anion-transporting  ArsA/GET3 family ATPase